MKRFKSIALTTLAVFIAVGSVVPIIAPTENASAQSSSLTIAPRKDYKLEAGDSIDDKISISNIDTTHELQLYLQVIDFTYTDETGSPKLMVNTDNDPTPWSLRNYLTVPQTVKIEPGGSKSIDVNVAIPSNVGAGSYYSAIIYSTSAPSGGNLGLAASGVTLVFVDVPGEVNESLTIKKLGAYNTSTKKYSYFNISEPTRIGYTILNDGNTAEAPVGTITVKGWFGKTYEIKKINPNNNLALIGQTRTFEACIKSTNAEVQYSGTTTTTSTCTSAGLWPGLYTVSLDGYYGWNGNVTKELVKTAYFWYLPVWFLVLLGIVLLVAAFYIWRTVVYFRGGSFKIGGRPHARSTRSHRRR